MLEKDRLPASSILNYLKWTDTEIDIASFNELAVETKDATRYTTIRGDRLDLLAYRFHGDPGLWWVIALANRDKILNPLVLPAGIELLIPSVDAVYSLMSSR